MPSTKMQNEPIFYVYALLDPRKPGPFRYGRWKFSHEPFYVGKGKGKRAWSHLDAAKRATKLSGKHKVSKIKKILRDTGKPPIVKIKRKGLLNQEAYELEQKLISKIGRSDLRKGPLVNHTDGGDGGYNQYFSKDTRDRISKNTKRMYRKRTADYHEQICERQSKGLKRYWNEMTSEERNRRAKISASSLLGLSSEALAARSKRISKCRKEYWKNLSPEAREELNRKNSEAQKRIWAERRSKSL